MLLQDNTQFNVIAIAALYQKGMPIDTIDQRRTALIGYATTPYDLPVFFNKLFSKEFKSSISIKVFDQNKDNLRNLIFKSSEAIEPQKSYSVLQTRTINFNDGNQWVIDIDSNNASHLFNYTPAWTVLITGLTISFLLYFLIKTQSEMRFNAQNLANQLTRDNRQLNQRLTLALNSAKMGVWELNPITGDLIWDQKQFEIFDFDQHHFTGKLQDWKSCIHPEDLNQSAKELEVALSGEKDFDVTFRVITKDQSIRYIKGQAIVIRNQSNKPLMMIGVNYDITEFMINQQSLTQAKDLAEVANLAKSRFLAKMSHEIRTPLNGIIGLSQLALNSNLSADAKDFFVKIFSSSKALLKTLNEILEFSKIEAGKFELENEVFLLDQILQETLDLYKPSAQIKNIQLNLVHDQKIPQYLQGDKNSIKQIIHNLLDNAIKFSTIGPITLKTTFIHQLDQMVNFEISVQDSGIGIDEKDLPFITRPFTQANQSIAENFGGTGLGLAISQELLKLMHSSLQIFSLPNKGTTISFHLYLPIVEKSEINNHIELDHENYQIHIHDKVLESKNVLIAEDNLINIEVLRQLMNFIKANIYIAHDGKECLEILSKNRIDMILMDIQMPELDGLETTKLIRAMPQFARLPIVGISAGLISNEKDLALAAGMDSFLTKPIDPEELIQAMTNLIYLSKET